MAETPKRGATSRIFPESSYFTQHRAPTLPSPAEIRALNVASGNRRATAFQRPSPVSFPALGLFVKYGSEVTVTEAETQAHLLHVLSGNVPIPEVFGWIQDGGQTFICMSFIQGETLQARFCGMDERERRAVCQELRSMVNAWRSISQDKSDQYIGKFCRLIRITQSLTQSLFCSGCIEKPPLIDIFLSNLPEPTGPFLGTDAVQAFHQRCNIEIDGSPPIVFTHNDLCPPNILLSSGRNPTVVAIVDWGQSGWYPAYWEYCKARRVGIVDDNLDLKLQEDWHTRHLPLVIDPVDNELYYYPWLYFMLAHL